MLSDPDPGSGAIGPVDPPTHIFESLETIFGVKP
jgi:hypothetical protein